MLDLSVDRTMDLRQKRLHFVSLGSRLSEELRQPYERFLTVFPPVVRQAHRLRNGRKDRP